MRYKSFIFCYFLKINFSPPLTLISSQKERQTSVVYSDARGFPATTFERQETDESLRLIFVNDAGKNKQRT